MATRRTDLAISMRDSILVTSEVGNRHMACIYVSLFNYDDELSLITFLVFFLMVVFFFDLF